MIFGLRTPHQPNVASWGRELTRPSGQVSAHKRPENRVLELWGGTAAYGREAPLLTCPEDVRFRLQHSLATMGK